MLTISKNLQQAIEHVSTFINGQWQSDSNKYIGIGYDDGAFDKATLKGFCLDEQEKVCCYCSREIFDAPSTQLEHIIPRDKSTDQSVLDKYFEYARILQENIVLQSVFSDTEEKLATPRFLITLHIKISLLRATGRLRIHRKSLPVAIETEKIRLILFLRY